MKICSQYNSAIVCGVAFLSMCTTQVRAESIDRTEIAAAKVGAIRVQSNGTTSDGNVTFSGNVSWYGPQFHGRKTASGEIFDMNELTAAHLTLGFGTRVLVEDPRTGNTVIVKVNDRGPYVRSRVMDLSKGSAQNLGTLSRGVAFVDCLVIRTSSVH